VLEYWGSADGDPSLTLVTIDTLPPSSYGDTERQCRERRCRGEDSDLAMELSVGRGGAPLQKGRG
jgi:hypothetical protein